MKSTDMILQEVRALSPRECAAAIAHYVYMLTADRVGWGKRVPTEWRDLSEETKEFNIAAVDTWVTQPELYDQWLRTIQDLLKQGSSD